MIIQSNEKMIRRNARIGQIASLMGVAILGVGLYITFKLPEQINYSFLSLLVGFILSQVGIFFGNRWGRRPRPDEFLEKFLKGLNRQFTLYNYRSPAQHLLVGPAGVWVILPKNLRGTITYAKNRIRQKGGNLYLKMFAQEGIGRPDLELASEMEAVQKMLKRHLQEDEVPNVNGIVVFTHDAADVKVDESPFPIVHGRSLKDWMRKTAKSVRFSDQTAQKINDLFSKG